MATTESKKADCTDAVRCIIVGLLFCGISFFTLQSGAFVVLILAAFGPSIFLLGIAGIFEPRVMEFGRKSEASSRHQNAVVADFLNHKNGDSKTLPTGVKVTAILCWTPMVLILGYFLIRKIANWG